MRQLQCRTICIRCCIIAINSSNTDYDRPHQQLQPRSSHSNKHSIKNLWQFSSKSVRGAWRWRRLGDHNRCQPRPHRGVSTTLHKPVATIARARDGGLRTPASVRVCAATAQTVRECMYTHKNIHTDMSSARICARTQPPVPASAVPIQLNGR